MWKTTVCLDNESDGARAARAEGVAGRTPVPQETLMPMMHDDQEEEEEGVHTGGILSSIGHALGFHDYKTWEEAAAAEAQFQRDIDLMESVYKMSWSTQARKLIDKLNKNLANMKEYAGQRRLALEKDKQVKGEFVGTSRSEGNSDRRREGFNEVIPFLTSIIYFVWYILTTVMLFRGSTGRSWQTSSQCSNTQDPACAGERAEDVAERFNH